MHQTYVHVCIVYITTFVYFRSIDVEKFTQSAFCGLSEPGRARLVANEERRLNGRPER